MCPGDEQLRLAAALSSRSDHPVSRAVAEYANGASSLPEVSQFAALQGRGVEGSIADQQYRLGNHRLVEELGACSPELEGRLTELEEQGKTVIVLLADKTPQAVVAIADTVRFESAAAISALNDSVFAP